ncbi:MAG TPA: 4-alpha-glucanotransferase, partial [Candidatus Sulfotelmatobacter sp.]|nr:4-alpha-glucanotransferase [Candidatus Sulfotelmatobacter sp.]
FLRYPCRPVPNRRIFSMRFPRASGILLHPTSLPGRYGVGDFGAEAFAFVDFLKDAGQKMWQVLPLNPTGYGDSPFQCFSAHAGNHLLINLEELREHGILEPADFRDQPEFPQDHVDFGRVIAWKTPLLKKAATRFLAGATGSDRHEFEEFRAGNASWLTDFALFMACKEEQRGIAWNKWPRDIAQRTPEGLRAAGARLSESAHAVEYWQFEFFRQWQQLRRYAREREIRIIGDIPIYVALDSADVWTNREYFQLSDDGQPLKIAGVPPDYFSATGQCWGNPIYRWERLKQDGYGWWVERFRAALELYDAVRIDHFRGFEAYWEIPGSETTAIHGQWVKGPGAELFAVLEREFGDLPIIAENLGVITPEVEAIRHRFHFPGMAILQFAFGKDPQGPSFRPHNYAREVAAYTGTHDNDTTLGWWNSSGATDSTRTPEDVAKEQAFARAYLNLKDDPIHWVMIRTIHASIADLAIVPLQDVLGLGSEARMNLPGTSSGNWRWRFKPGALTPEHAKRLRELVLLYDR